MSVQRSSRVVATLIIGLTTPLALTAASSASPRSTADSCGSALTVQAPAAGRTTVTPSDVGLPARAASLTAAASRVHAHWLTSIQCRTLPRNHSPQPATRSSRPAVRSSSLAATALTYNWSGYNVNTSQTPTAVSASWTEPTVSLPFGSTEAHSAIWVGMGGMPGSSGELVQDGTGQDVSISGSSHYFWFELYPIESAQVITSPAMALNPGDQVSASSSWANGKATFGLCNLTTAQCVSFWQYSPAPGHTAEWIVEAPEYNGQQATLPIFTAVPFTSAAFQAPSAQTPTQGGSTDIDMVDQSGTVIAAPGSLCGGAFTVTYQGSGSPPPPSSTCPSVPRSVHLTNGPSGGALTTVATWAPPLAANPAITSYQVRIQGRSPQGTYTGYRYATVPGTTTKLNIAGTRGYLYRVQVIARNSAGFGPWSAWSNFAYPR